MSHQPAVVFSQNKSAQTNHAPGKLMNKVLTVRIIFFRKIEENTIGMQKWHITR
jgi:hypothetical protein